MRTGSSQPSIVIDAQELVAPADRVASVECQMGNPPRVIRGPDVCDLFHARDQEVLPGFVERWRSLGIEAQVVVIQPTRGEEAHGRMPR